MKSYVALLRGVSPLNAKMPELKRAFEAAGFKNVKTVLGSGNVVFSDRSASETAVGKRSESAMAKTLRKSFPTIVRSIDDLSALLLADPFAQFHLGPQSKRVVTFLRQAPTKLPPLPIEKEGAYILNVSGREVLTAYTPGPRGPVFMALIERTFGKDVTTRTWDTVARIVRAAS